MPCSKMMEQQPGNIPCDGGPKFHCESTCQLTSSELVMVHFTHSTSAMYLLCLFQKFSNHHLCPPLSSSLLFPSSLSPSNAASQPFAKYCSSVPGKAETFQSLQNHPLSLCCFALSLHPVGISEGGRKTLR